jgi:hypothetical protein
MRELDSFWMHGLREREFCKPTSLLAYDRSSSEILLRDLALELDRIAAVLTHGLSPRKPGPDSPILSSVPVHPQGCTPRTCRSLAPFGHRYLACCCRDDRPSIKRNTHKYLCDLRKACSQGGRCGAQISDHNACGPDQKALTTDRSPEFLTVINE